MAGMSYAHCDGIDRVGPTGALVFLMWREGGRLKRSRIKELSTQSEFLIKNVRDVLRTCVLRRFVDFVLPEGKKKTECSAEDRIFFLTSLGARRARKIESMLLAQRMTPTLPLQKSTYGDNAALIKKQHVRRKASQRTDVCGNSQSWAKLLSDVFSENVDKMIGRDDFLNLACKRCGFDLRYSEAMLRCMRKDGMVHMDSNDMITLKKRGRMMLYNSYGIGTYVPSRKKEMFDLLSSVAEGMDICASSFRNLKKRLKEALLALLLELCAMRMRMVNVFT